MKKLKLMTIIGTRPEIIKMSAIIKQLIARMKNRNSFLNSRSIEPNTALYFDAVNKYGKTIIIYDIVDSGKMRKIFCKF